MGNALETVKTTASEQFENVTQFFQEKIPVVKDSVQEKIPVLKSKLNNTISFCKSALNPKEDEPEIYALYSDKEEPMQESNKFNSSVELNPEFSGMNNTPEVNMGNGPRQIDDKDYLRELIEICNKNGETPPYEDFSQNAWEHFYSADDPFFLWNKGQVMPNQVKVSNPYDFKKLEIYQGDLTPNLATKHGFGILTTPFYVRIGQWRYGQFTGWGREARRNGEVLEGRFTNGRVNGKGIFITAKGNKYIGDFYNNRLHGKGKLTTKSLQYAGQFKNNKMDGMGKIIFNNGHQYEGEFRENQINGKGKFTWQNGDVYEGMMAKGKMNGYGRYTYASNGQVYEGEFVNGVKRGQGKIIYPDGKIYEGKFVNGVPQGQGVIIKDKERTPIIFKNGKAYAYYVD